MRQFLAIAGPVIANFVLWTVIAVLHLHAFITLALVLISGVLMLCGMAYFGKTADKDQQAPESIIRATRTPPRSA